MPLKEEVFRTLDSVCDEGAIIASNTSYLDVNHLADMVPRRKGNVLGMHFFSPAQVMRLLEVVRTDSVSPETLAAVLALGRRLGKIAVVAGVCHGFIGNRMLEGYTRQVRFLLEEGASPVEVDAALTGFGMAMGPCAVADLAGLDVSWRKRKADAHLRDPSKRYSAVADRLCERGRFGQKTGAGYYLYEPGSRTPIPDPEVDALIAEVAAESGITRRTVGADEIVERLLYPLVNEGARILDEGIALRSSDIDIVWINGYGFPPLARWRHALGRWGRTRRHSHGHRTPQREPALLGAGAAAEPARGGRQEFRRRRSGRVRSTACARVRPAAHSPFGREPRAVEAAANLPT